jgi:hypothetical protein
MPGHGRRMLLVTAVVFPVLVTVVAAGVIGGFSRLGAWFRPPAKPAITATQPPRFASAGPHEQALAKQAGIDIFWDGICPWDVQTLLAPPSRVPAPLPDDGSLSISQKYESIEMGDANYTRVILFVKPPDGHSVRVNGVHIRVIQRRPAPGPQAATVVALAGAGGCGAGPDTVSAHALLDSGANDIVVTPDRGSDGFPQLAQPNGISIKLVIGSATCDCTWVPVVFWNVDSGAETQTAVRMNGADLRTIPTAGLWRLAWRQDWTQLSARLHGWTRVPFQDELLKADPNYSNLK